MPSNHCFQLSARFNVAELMFSNYRNVTGEIEKLFSSSVSLRRKKQRPQARFVSQRLTITVIAATFMTVLPHPMRAELITAALSRECQKASEENVNQRLKYKQTKPLEGEKQAWLSRVTTLHSNTQAGRWLLFF